LRSYRQDTAEFVALPQNELDDTAQDYLNKLESSKNSKTGKPYSPGYVSNCLDAIRSWADWNRKRFQRTIKIANPRGHRENHPQTEREEEDNVIKKLAR